MPISFHGRLESQTLNDGYLVQIFNGQFQVKIVNSLVANSMEGCENR